MLRLHYLWLCGLCKMKTATIARVRVRVTDITEAVVIVRTDDDAMAVGTPPLAGVSALGAEIEPLAQVLHVREVQRRQAPAVRGDLVDGLVRYLTSALQILGLVIP